MSQKSDDPPEFAKHVHFVDEDECLKEMFGAKHDSWKTKEEAEYLCGRVFSPMFFEVADGIYLPLDGWEWQ